AIRLTMTSEDVIHSFFVPAFRVKSDVVPGKYATMWFTPTKTGRFHLFCAEFCGNRHSGMIGWIDVMDPKDYQNWLNSNPPHASSPPRHADETGRNPFKSHGLPGLQ